MVTWKTSAIVIVSAGARLPQAAKLELSGLTVDMAVCAALALVGLLLGAGILAVEAVETLDDSASLCDLCDKRMVSHELGMESLCWTGTMAETQGWRRRRKLTSGRRV